MDFESVSFVIPAFNEEQGVGPMVEALVARFPDNEIFVVDDGSTDRTVEMARKAGATVLRHETNLGYGASLRTGIEMASGDYVLCCDADGQHTIEDIERVIEACDAHDMVVGKRGEDSHVSKDRAPGKAVLAWFGNLLAGQKIPDINSGLRLFRREIILKYIHLMPQGFSFSTTSTFAMLKTRRRILWVPITTRRRVGKSTVSQLRHGPQTLMLILRLAVLFEPLKVFLSVAGGLFCLDVLSFLWDLAAPGTGGLSDTTVLLSIATLIVFMFGLLCDQVSALRRQMHE